MYTIMVFIMMEWSYIMLKNITLSAEEELIREAREKARREHTTLNATFREWLRQYTKKGREAIGYRELMELLSYAQSSKSFTRDEMNER